MMAIKKIKQLRLSLFQKFRFSRIAMSALLLAGCSEITAERIKFLINPSAPIEKDDEWSAPANKSKLASKPENLNERNLSEKKYQSNEIIQRLFRPIKSECVECFDTNNSNNGPDQFYLASRIRFHQNNIEEGLSYLELAAKHGHPTSIHNLAIIYDEGIFGSSDKRKAYLYFELLSIYSKKFELQTLYLQSEKSIRRLEAYLVDEDFDWIEIQIKKLNIH